MKNFIVIEEADVNEFAELVQQYRDEGYELGGFSTYVIEEEGKPVPFFCQAVYKEPKRCKECGRSMEDERER